MKDFNKVMFAIIDKKGNIDISTLNYRKVESIRAFLRYSDLGWRQAKMYGWKCVKVDVSIMPSSND